MKSKILVKSPFFTINVDKQVLTDTISGKKYKVAIEIIEFANSYTLLNKKHSEHDKLIIDKLRSIGFLICENELNKLTYQLKLQNDAIFGFEPYIPKQEIKNVVFVGIPFGNGNYTSNETRKFPDFFRKMCTTQNLTFRNVDGMSSKFLSSFSQYCQNNIKRNLSNNLVKDAGNIYMHQYETRKDNYSKIELISSNLFNNKDIPFFIGGDHSITYPIIKAACKSYKKFCVLHFDAHTDTYSSSSNEILESNQLHHHGNFVSKVLKLDNVTKYYQFGLRGMMNSEGVENEKIVSYWTHSIKDNLKQIELSDDENYYITFDIDVLDPSFAPGTATPVPNGLSISEVHNLFNHLLENKKIIGIDFVEVNPIKDINSITMNLAIELIFRLFSYIKL